MMSDRLPCCVPFCRRTTKAGRFTDWICAKHWPLVSLETRGAYNLAKRRARRIIARRPIYREYWKLPAGSPERLRAVRMWRRIDAAWARCKCEAIERAAGI
ncbi:hypothetical protein IMF23_04400 [Chelatococcus daeguensis]|uniref:Uncharacterized protein n=1 Tax=Chelatococcus sambhunathii TaxID=363953 RepID=A0ABM9U9E6_9HYPH|nr:MULTISPECIES: hypothetical protein [Chelatococcus]KZE34119.1 hypothetical protein AVW15_17545 [Chelatococcus daeguensis]MBM3082677.1 hypothetical protein [Chelatococcus daeguensis]CUA90888.1 hypothetical protein Ga0061061_11634 [Chelatococcus sambhunathii]